MTPKQQEFAYFATTIGATLITSILLFGIDNLKKQDLVLNIHDTYFVMNKFHYFMVCTPITFVLLYTIRVVIQRFKNLISNLILAISNGLLLIILLNIVLNRTENEINLNHKFWMILLCLSALEIYIVIKLTKALTHKTIES